jgi:hypothetical protein
VRLIPLVGLLNRAARARLIDVCHFRGFAILMAFAYALLALTILPARLVS